jgi:hypothetical protein
MVVKNNVEEVAKLYSHGSSGLGYRTEARATRAPNIATKKHHKSMEPSMPPQIAVIL